jgi:peptidyl-prolyl cis-trans isomerase SurA
MKRMGTAMLLGCAVVGLAPAAAGQTVEQIVAKVNGDIITLSELEGSLEQLQAQIRASKLSPQEAQQALAQGQKDLLRNRIDELLLVQKGKDLNINVDSDVSKRLADIQKQSGIADPDKFQQWVREQSGTTFEDFRQEIKNQFITRRVIGQEVGSRINIPRAEIEKYYKEHQSEFIRKESVFLSEIFINTEGKTPEEQAALEKKAKDLVARARKGERFSDLARDNSDNANTASQGGSVGVPMEKGMLRPEFEKVVWDQPKGYITDPIKLANGWEILKVEDHLKEGLAPLSDVEGDIQEKLYTPLFEPKVREYLSELRREAFMEIREGFVDSGAATGKATKWEDPAILRPETTTKEAVAAQTRIRRLLWAFPVPGTQTGGQGKSSSK